MHLRLAIAAAAVTSVVSAAPALAGPPKPPPLMTCQDYCQVDPDYTAHVKQWVSATRDWATNPPKPALTECPDACPPTANGIKPWVADMEEWLLP